MIPEADVLECGGVRVDVATRQQRVAREFPLLDVVQAEGVPRRGDVVDDERRLLHLFVGGDDEPLHRGGVAGPDEHGQHIDGARRREWPQ